MSMKKLIAAGIAASVAAAAAVSVSAATLGSSTEATDFYAEAGQETVINTTVTSEYGEEVNISVRIPADALEEGAYTFEATPVADENFRMAFVDSLGDGIAVDYFEAYEFSFKGEDGNPVSPAGVVITIQINEHINNVYVENEDGTFHWAGRLDTVPGGYQFTAPHFSRFVFVNLQPLVPDPGVDPTPEPEPISPPEPDTSPEPEPEPQPQSEPQPQPKPDDKGANTGDSAATAVVFGIMGLAALGTAVIASKSKKTSK